MVKSTGFENYFKKSTTNKRIKLSDYPPPQKKKKPNPKNKLKKKKYNI